MFSTIMVAICFVVLLTIIILSVLMEILLTFTMYRLFKRRYDRNTKGKIIDTLLFIQIGIILLLLFTI